MKNKASIKWLITIVVVISIASLQTVSAQTTRLPDGTVVYSDGTVRLPNGQVRYPNKTYGNTYPTNYPDYGNGRYPRRAVRQGDGSVIYPDGRIVYPDGTIRYPDGRVYSPSNNSRWIPPGQARKMYGKGYRKGWKHKEWKRNNRREHDDRHEDD